MSKNTRYELTKESLDKMKDQIKCGQLLLTGKAKAAIDELKQYKYNPATKLDRMVGHPSLVAHMRNVPVMADNYDCIDASRSINDICCINFGDGDIYSTAALKQLIQDNKKSQEQRKWDDMRKKHGLL